MILLGTSNVLSIPKKSYCRKIQTENKLEVWKITFLVHIQLLINHICAGGRKEEWPNGFSPMPHLLGEMSIMSCMMLWCCCLCMMLWCWSPTRVVAGTPEYIHPVFIKNRWPRTELHVYDSFGIVLLEVACGKRPVSRQPNGASSLLFWVHGLYDQGMVLDAADWRLNGEFDQRQMERVIVTGLWCAHQDPMQRPSIVQAMDVLRSASTELPVIPAMRDARHIRSMEEQALCRPACWGSFCARSQPKHVFYFQGFSLSACRRMIKSFCLWIEIEIMFWNASVWVVLSMSLLICAHIKIHLDLFFFLELHPVLCVVYVFTLLCDPRLML